MSLPQEILKAVSAQAETIPERIANDRNYDGEPDRIADWESKYSQELFESRLDWFGTTKAQVNDIFGDIDTTQVSVNEWAQRLAELLSAFESADSTHRPDSEIPFGDLLEPLVDVATDEIETVSSPESPIKSVHPGFRNALLHQLSIVASRALHVEYRMYCHEEYGSANPTVIAREHGSGADIYKAFIDEFHDSRYSEFFKTYAMLGRQIVTVIDCWQGMVIEFYERFRNDRAQLSQASTTDSDTTAIGLESVQPGLGDPHEGGRTVVQCELSDGSTWFYKPRPTKTEATIHNLFEWINQANQFDSDFQTVRHLHKDGYGWSEAVYQFEMDPGQEYDYYYRIGGLSILLYSLGASDIHHENLVASGEYPTIVDWEVLVSPSKFEVSLPESEADTKLMVQERVDSVLNTMLLPHQDIATDRVKFDLSAVGRLTSSELDQTTMSWTAINSNGMHFQEVPEVITPEENVPKVDGEIVPPEQWTDAIIEGAHDMYDLINDNKDEFLSKLEEGGLETIPVRYLMRPTLKYQSIRMSLWSPENLRDGVSAWLAVEGLFASHDAVVEQAYRELWRIADKESNSLLRGDIPRFVTEQGSLLNEDEEVLEGFLEEKKMQFVRSRLASFGPADKQQQLAYIEAVVGRRGEITEQNVRREGNP